MKLSFYCRLALIGLLCTALGVTVQADQSAKPKDCEICQQVLSKVSDKFKVELKAAKADKKKVNKEDLVERLIDEYCESASTATEKKVCYYITPIKRKVSPLLANHAPVDRLCKKLKKESPELCHVREAVKVTKGETDYGKLSVRDLKKILADRGVSCKNCIEKSDLVRRCKETEDLEHLEL